MVNLFGSHRIVKHLIILALLCNANGAMAESNEELQSNKLQSNKWLNDAELYVLLGIPGANHQSGAIGTSGNSVTNPTMNCCQGSYFGTFKVGIQEKINDTFIAEFFHLNEGHLADDKPNSSSNHRDGFGFALGARKVMDDVILQLNVGPYFAMNTVTVNGIQYDRKEHGYLVAALFEKDINSRGLKFRMELDHTSMYGTYNGHKTFDGTTLQVGLAQSISQMSKSKDSTLPPYQWAVIYGRTKTNSSSGGFAQNVQVKFTEEIDEHQYPGITISESVISEGNTGATDRKGVGLQLGYEVISTKDFRTGFEGGTFLAHDTLSGTNSVNGLITIFVEKHICRKYILRGQFERVVSLEGPAKDADHFMVGVGHDF
jgi:hypothetical protein